MAILPSAVDLKRRPAPSDTPNIRVAPIDYSPEAAAGKAIGEGVSTIGAGVRAMLDANAEVDDYETRKKLLDFKLKTEMEHENFKRTMPAGGGDFARSWDERYKEMAREFVGEGDANIPQSQRAKVGLHLKQHEVMLSERAQRAELAERDKATIEGLETTLGRTRDQVQVQPDQREKWLQEGHALIDGSALPTADKYRLRQKFTKEIDKSYGEALVNGIKSKEDLEFARSTIAPHMPDRRAERAAMVAKADSDGMAVVQSQSAAKFRVHGAYADRFAGLIADLEAAGVDIKAEESGGYANRNIAGTNKRSRHADGEAIDINWSQNGRGKAGAMAAQLSDDQINALAAKHGLKWGGTWANRDDMHFEVDKAARPEPAAEGDGYRGPMGSLSVDERRAIFKRADERYRQMVGDTEKIIKEQMSVAGDGYLPPQPILDQLDGRVKSLGDPLLSAQYDSMLRKARITQQLSKAPPAVIEALARRERDAAAQGGATKEQDEAIKHLETLAANVRKATNENPMGWGHRQQIEIPLAVEPPSDLEPRAKAQWKAPTQTLKLESLDFAASDIDLKLARRAEQAVGVGHYLGQPPQMFTVNERDFLKDRLAVGGPGMVQAIGKIAKAAAVAGIEPSLVMREFSKDAPELAVIGDMVANNADPAVLATASKAMAWKTAQKDKFESTIDKTQAKPTLGEFADVLSTQPTRSDAVKHAANLIYEYEHRLKGKTQFDPSLYEDIVGRVMGQTKDQNGNTYGGIGAQGAGWSDGKWSSGGFFGSTPKVLVPSEVRSDKFDDMVGAIRAKDLADPPRDGGGNPLPMKDIRQAAWVSVGHGRYILELKRDADGNRVLATREGGDQYVLDIRPILPAIQKRRPDIFRGYDGNKAGALEPDPAYAFGYSGPN